MKILSKWENAKTKMWIKYKYSTRNLIKLCEKNATDKLTLVVHSEDVDFKPYFSNTLSITKRKDIHADIHCDLYYTELAKMDVETFDVILCTGLLEHVPDPQRLIDDLYNLLLPGGKLILSASAVFSVHEGPNNFFHFTKYGMQLLLKNFSRVSIEGSCGPFENIGIQIQRILIQSKINPLIRPFLEIFALGFRYLDKMVQEQYDHVGIYTDDHKIDSMLPSNIQAIAYK
jgi:SAM-dependent methyltransferase